MPGLTRVWAALAGLVAGVLAPAPAWLPWCALACGIAAAVRRRSSWRGAAVVAIAFGLGALDAAARAPERTPAAQLASNVPSCRVAGRTLEEAGGLGVLAAIDVAECEGHARVDDAGAVFLDDAGVGPGRRFVADGWLVPLTAEPFDEARRRAGAAAAFEASSGEDLGPASPLHALAGRVREGLAVATAPLGRPGALLRGLTIGDTSAIDGGTEEALRRSGLAHLLAVSGSNVAILLGAVALALRRAPFVARTAACALSLALFVIVVGPDASVLRAGGMGVAMLAGLAYGRRTEPLQALGVALVAVVALRPGIVHSTGLHLSAAATAGIVLWTRPLTRRLRRLPGPLATALAATLAAQVAVAPLLVGVFGRLPLAGVIANVVAIPAVAPATVLGLTAAAAGAVAPLPAALLARAAAPFAGWVLAVGEWCGAHPWASPAVPRSGGFALAVAVLALAIRALPGALRPGARNLDGATSAGQPEGR